MPKGMGISLPKLSVSTLLTCSMSSFGVLDVSWNVSQNWFEEKLEEPAQTLKDAANAIGRNFRTFLFVFSRAWKALGFRLIVVSLVSLSEALEIRVPSGCLQVSCWFQTKWCCWIRTQLQVCVFLSLIRSVISLVMMFVSRRTISLLEWYQVSLQVPRAFILWFKVVLRALAWSRN